MFPKSSNLDSDAISVAISSTLTSDPMIEGYELIQSSGTHGKVSSRESIKSPYKTLFV
jgi:hypothetical protein